jgi:hypothetical protein
MKKVANFLTDECPCGSGLLMKDCCLTKTANTTPPLPKTGFSNPKCYAYPLNDCSEKITAEHFISESVLKIISNSGSLKLGRAPWLPSGEERIVSLQSLSSNILCERHNTALSPLDTNAWEFFQFLMGNDDRGIFLVNGKEIERWMLKLLCGAIYSGNAVPAMKNLTAPIDWLNMLFGSETIPDGCGLSFVNRTEYRASRHRIDFFLWWDSPNLINGISFEIWGFRFLFMVRPIPPVLNSFPDATVYYHPGVISIQEDDLEREIHFGWPEDEPILVDVHKI